MEEVPSLGNPLPTKWKYIYVLICLPSILYLNGAEEWGRGYILLAEAALTTFDQLSVSLTFLNVFKLLSSGPCTVLSVYTQWLSVLTGHENYLGSSQTNQITIAGGGAPPGNLPSLLQRAAKLRATAP